MKAKKLLSLLLALVLCLGTLAACNSDPKETTQSTTKATEGTTAATTAATTEATEPEPLTNLDRYPIDFSGTLTAVTTKTEADKAHNYLLFEELTGVDIDWQIMSSEQVPLTFVGNSEMPDIFFNASGISINQMNEYGAAGKLVNLLDEEILDKMPNLKAAYEADPKLFDAVKDPNGAAYAFPAYYYTLTMGSNMIFIRTDMTKKAGIEELPTTVEGFLEMCETLKNYYKDVEGYVPMVTNGGAGVKFGGVYAFPSMFFPAMGEYMKVDIGITLDGNTIYAGFATEQYKRYLEFMNTCWEKGYLDPNCYATESNTDKAMMIEGKTTMNPNGTYMLPENFYSGSLEDFTVLPPMTSQYQNEARWAFPNRYRTTTMAISTTCKDIDAACAFFDAMYATQDNPIKDENGVKAWSVSLWLGELGEDFVMNEEEKTYAVLPHDGYDTGAAWLTANSHSNANYMEWPYVEKSESGLMTKALGQRDVLYPYGVQVQETSLLILNQEEQDTYNDCWTDINNKVTEMTAAFITGQADLEKDWDTYINDLYDMGLQEVIDVYQAALDRYNGK